MDYTQIQKDMKLIGACRGNDEGRAILALEEGGNPSTHHSCALALAAQKGWAGLVERMIERGASVSGLNGEPLKNAVKANHPEIVDMILAQGRAGEHRAWEAMVDAAGRDLVEMVRMLCDRLPFQAHTFSLGIARAVWGDAANTFTYLIDKPFDGEAVMTGLRALDRRANSPCNAPLLKEKDKAKVQILNAAMDLAGHLDRPNVALAIVQARESAANRVKSQQAFAFG